MGFLFRVEQIKTAGEHTVLTGHMLGGALNYHQRIDVQIGEELKTVFTAPLCGLASSEDTGLTMFDPSLWEKVLALPLSISREKQVGLIVDGAAPPASDLPLPAIAAGIDMARPSAQRRQTAIRSAAVPAPSGGKFGLPMREYPYQISRRGMLLFAPWGLFVVTIVLSLLVVAFAFHKLPLHGSSLGKVLACGMLGLFDVLFLYFSIKMMLAKPGPVIVTTSGIVVPIIQPGFSSHHVFVSFDEMDDMLEYWHDDTVQLLKLKAADGTIHLNPFLMQGPHFEELRRLLWRHVREKRGQDTRPQLTAGASQAFPIDGPRQTAAIVGEKALTNPLDDDKLQTSVKCRNSPKPGP